MFQRLHKWFVVRCYARKLSAKLLERYGLATRYSPEQVVTTVQKCGFNKDWIRYALCMFCDYDDLAKSEAAAAAEYAVIRTELAKRFFRGASFTAVDFVGKPARVPSVSNEWQGPAGGFY
jgi:uncharacterized protein DUF6559